MNEKNIMKVFYICILILINLFLSGCSKNYITPKADSQYQDYVLGENEAGIIFYRSPLDGHLSPRDLIPLVGSFISTYPMNIAEIVNNSEAKNIVFIWPGQKYFYRTNSGIHLFISFHGTPHILEATLYTNKIYYVEVEQVSGIRTSFKFIPQNFNNNPIPETLNKPLWYLWVKNSKNSEYKFLSTKHQIELTIENELRKTGNKVIMLPESGIDISNRSKLIK